MPARLLRLAALAGLTLVLMGGAGVARQQPATPAAPAPVNESDDPVLREFRFRSIGPAVMGGGRGGGGGGAMVEPGTYLVRINVGGQTLTTSVQVLEDVWLTRQG